MAMQWNFHELDEQFEIWYFGVRSFLFAVASNANGRTLCCILGLSKSGRNYGDIME